MVVMLARIREEDRREWWCAALLLAGEEENNREGEDRRWLAAASCDVEKQREIDGREGSGCFGWKKKNGRGALCLAVEEEGSRREVAAAGVKIKGVEVIEETRVFTESRVVRVRVRYRWVLDGLRDLD